MRKWAWQAKSSVKANAFDATRNFKENDPDS